jgi:hypothetical protein
MKERIISLALLAAVSIGVAPAFAQVSEDASSITNNDNVIADCMIQHQNRRIYKKCAAKKARKCTKKAAVQKVVKTETIKTIEKPVVIQPQQEQQVEQTVEKQAVVETQQPVIIDRFEKRHRSLLHLGLFPFSLFGR